MPIAEAVGVREGWLQVFPPWITTRVAKAKSLMIFKGEALYCTLCLLVQIEIKGLRYIVRLLSFRA